MGKKVLLMILDGWGIAENKSVSAIDKAQTPFIDGLYDTYPHSKLSASGLDVGLPEGQMGNSEVGHMNIGAGRVVYQDLVKITNAVQEGSILQQSAMVEALDYAETNNKPIHFIGLVSDGGVHAHIDHLKGLMRICGQREVPFHIHAFTDGRDCDPKSGLGFLASLEQEKPGCIASVTGRYFAMDRDRRWERVKKAYDALVHGVGEETEDVLEAVKNSYEKNVTDEFIEPIVRVRSGEPAGCIREGDVVFCFNFRTDRGREITQVLTQQEFPEFEMRPLDLHYVTMTNYDHTFKNVQVVYDKENLTQTLGEVLEQQGRKQIRIAETEKYPHVTFFFSGGREDEFQGESRILIPSPKVPTYDLQPEMSAEGIRDAIIPELSSTSADFVCLNFANPDMVGHTGVFEAAVKACETVDACAEKVVAAALASDYVTIIIADHGNSDKMINPDGSPNTAHTTSLVPCILVSNERGLSIRDGKLGDLAPTILTIMDLPIPAEMTGKVLVW